MTPKEKAQELIEKFTHLTWDLEDDKEDHIRKSKDCALIAVDEIINLLRGTKFLTPDLTISYWVKVKKEIEKI